MNKYLIWYLKVNGKTRTLTVMAYDQVDAEMKAMKRIGRGPAAITKVKVIYD